MSELPCRVWPQSDRGGRASKQSRRRSSFISPSLSSKRSKEQLAWKTSLVALHYPGNLVAALCVAASTWTPRTPKNLVFFVPWRTLHFFRSHTHARSTAPPYLTPLSSSFITIPYLTPASFLPSAQEACFRSVFSRVCVFHPIFLLYSLLAHFLPHPMLPAPPCSL